jgi:hypothetical protein
MWWLRSVPRFPAWAVPWSQGKGDPSQLRPENVCGSSTSKAYWDPLEVST